VYYRVAFPDVPELLAVARRLLHEIVTAEGALVDDLEQLPRLTPR
jgi:ArsR family transcriptional regulator